MNKKKSIGEVYTFSITTEQIREALQPLSESMATLLCATIKRSVVSKSSNGTQESNVSVASTDEEKNVEDVSQQWTMLIDNGDIKSAGDEYSEAMHIGVAMELTGDEALDHLNNRKMTLSGDVSIDCDSFNNEDAGAVEKIRSTLRECGVQDIPTNCLLDVVADKREEGLLRQIGPDDGYERGGLIFSYQSHCYRVGMVFDGGGGCQGAPLCYVNIGSVWEASTKEFDTIVSLVFN